MYNIICSLAEARAISSVGQSNRLITGWSGVRVPDGPPIKPAGNILPVLIFLVWDKQRSNPCINLIWGYSSDGRAAVSKTACREFDPFCPRQPKKGLRFTRWPFRFYRLQRRNKTWIPKVNSTVEFTLGIHYNAEGREKYKKLLDISGDKWYNN